MMNNLDIKLFNLRDKEDLYQILVDKELEKYYPNAYCDTEERFEEVLKRFLSPIYYLTYGIYLKNKMIGFITKCISSETEIVLTYALNPDFRKKGYMEKALRKFIAEEIKPFSKKELVIKFYINEENEASINLVKKIGTKKITDSSTYAYEYATYELQIEEFGKNN